MAILYEEEIREPAIVKIIEHFLKKLISYFIFMRCTCFTRSLKSGALTKKSALGSSNLGQNHSHFGSRNLDWRRGHGYYGHYSCGEKIEFKRR